MIARVSLLQETSICGVLLKLPDASIYSICLSFSFSVCIQAAAKLAKRMIQALAYCHKKNIVHRYVFLCSLTATNVCYFVNKFLPPLPPLHLLLFSIDLSCARFMIVCVSFCWVQRFKTWKLRLWNRRRHCRDEIDRFWVCKVSQRWRGLSRHGRHSVRVLRLLIFVVFIFFFIFLSPGNFFSSKGKNERKALSTCNVNVFDWL